MGPRPRQEPRPHPRAPLEAKRACTDAPGAVARRNVAAALTSTAFCMVRGAVPMSQGMDLLPVISTGDLKRRSAWVRGQLLPGIGARWVNTKSGLALRPS